MLISKNKKILKIFSIVFVFGFLFFCFYNFFSPTKATAAGNADFNVAADKTTAEAGTSITITVFRKMTATQTSSGNVQFISSPTGGSFSAKECTLRLDLTGQRCTVTFAAQQSGTFKITGILVEQLTAGGTVTTLRADTTVTITESISGITSQSTDTNYVPLAKLPGLEDKIETSKQCTTTNGVTTCANPCPFGKYLNILIKLFLGISAVLAMIMIVWGGIQYMTSELASSKEAGRESITHAVLGLLLALGAWLLLFTLNPDLLNICLDNVKPVEIIIGPESVVDAGSGVNINGTTVKISNGSAVTCSGGIVSIPSDIGSGNICKDLLNRLLLLRNKTTKWTVTSTLRNGGAASSCHYTNSPNSGNCADLQITDNVQARIGYNKDNGGSTNPVWGDFCVAVAQTGGLNFLNEASSVATCQQIINYKAYSQTSGPHLHVNYIGDSGGNNNQTREAYGAAPTIVGKIVFIPINNYVSQNEHKVKLANTANTYQIIKTNPSFTNGQLAITLSDDEHNKLKGTSKIQVTSASLSLGERTLIIP